MAKKYLLYVLFISVIHLTYSPNNCNGQWIQTNDGMPANGSSYALLLNGNNILTSCQGVYVSTNNGANWTQNGLSGKTIYSLASTSGNIFAGLGNLEGVYRTTNNGAIWTVTFLNNKNVNALLVQGNTLFAGVTTNGVYSSTDNGAYFGPTSLSMQSVYSLASDGSRIFAGTGTNGIYISTNNGVNWTQTTLGHRNVLSIAVYGNKIFAGTANNPTDSGGVYISTNSGTNWTQSSLNNQYIRSLTVSGNNVFAGTDDGVYLSTNNGLTWTTKSEGMTPGLSVYSFLIKDSYIFAATFIGRIWRRPLSELITGYNTISTEIPSSFSLMQNYPNPFNPNTVISFRLSVAGQVTLKIYDVLGKEVETLVSEKLEAGTYSVNWDASKYSSGVYFYRIQAGDFVDTKRMTFIK